MADSIDIPGYSLEKQLGTGAMGTVYQATHKLLDCKVAVKFMAKELANDLEYRTRFLNEARNIAKLKHPNIIHIHEINVHESNYYIAMEFASGGTLKGHIKRGITPVQALKILRDLAAALDCAHRKGIIHRDIKPANIFFREDSTVVLADFGIAKQIDGDPNLTRTHGTLGTPAYMSPEQVMGKMLDRRSDLYSLGVVFFEMLTSQKPYRARNADSVTLMHLSDPVPRLPRALRDYRPIIYRLMAKNPAQRFQSATELIHAIDHLPGNRAWFKAVLAGLSLLAVFSLPAAYFIPQLRCFWQPIKFDVDYFYRSAGRDN
ncbi:MAG: serine/threonine-protein kinase, partial [Methylococcales bacterium]